VKVRHTRAALRQLGAILAYIETHSPQGALKVKARIAQLIGILETQPFIGAATNKRGIRRAVAAPYPYIVLYEVRDGEIVIRAVRHGARRGR
jgi:toxin ParE1/3/4